MDEHLFWLKPELDALKAECERLRVALRLARLGMHKPVCLAEIDVPLATHAVGRSTPRCYCAELEEMEREEREGRRCPVPGHDTPEARSEPVKVRDESVPRFQLTGAGKRRCSPASTRASTCGFWTRTR
jgi:hypothetical protein